MVAVKFFDDKFYKNTFFGKVGGVPGREMGGMELEFLQLIDWRLHVHPSVVEIYCKYLVGV
jgi:hypothetical protein